MNTRLKTIATAVALLIVFLVVTARQKNLDVRSQIQAFLRPSSPQSPEDGVYKMLDAARAGDADHYLDCFSGAMRTQIEQAIKETSRIKFIRYLKNQNKLITSVAVSVREQPAENDARVRVEYVFPGRNEVQDLYLRREGVSWRIVKVVGSEQIATLIPYGTTVTD